MPTFFASLLTQYVPLTFLALRLIPKSPGWLLTVGTRTADYRVLTYYCTPSTYYGSMVRSTTRKPKE